MRSPIAPSWSASADRDRYRRALFAPAEQRGALHALYAFNVEISRVREWRASRCLAKSACNGGLTSRRRAARRGERQSGRGGAAPPRSSAIGSPAERRSTIASGRAGSISTTSRCRALPSWKTYAKNVVGAVLRSRRKFSPAAEAAAAAGAARAGSPHGRARTAARRFAVHAVRQSALRAA